jgi:energy-converting hydrogenase Eha subunit A
MNAALISLAVTAAFFAVAVILGGRLERSAKPYPKGLLIAHIVPFFLIGLGIGTCLDKLQGVTPAMPLATLALYAAGATLNASMLTGIVMIIRQQKSRPWIKAHKLATLVMALGLVASAAFMALKK